LLRQVKLVHLSPGSGVVRKMMDCLFGSDDFALLPHLVALAVAYLLAVPIGWNREREERSAGLRTFPLVALATCGFIQATETIMVTSPEAMARIVEGAIVGMGFIGGGAILRRSTSVKGTATAASLWVPERSEFRWALAATTSQSSFRSSLSSPCG
jgi:hypothetical protein